MKKFLCLIFGASLSIYCPAATANEDMHYSINKKVANAWDRSGDRSDKEAIIGFLLSRQNKVDHVMLKKSSGSAQFDAECLEAVCSFNPKYKDDFHPSRNYVLKFTADECKTLTMDCQETGFEGVKPRYDGSDIEKYLHAQKRPNGSVSDFVVVHKIPLCILDQFPGLFKVNELLNPSNLIELKVSSSKSEKPSFDQVLEKMYKGLGLLHDKNKTEVSRNDVLQAFDVR